MKRPAATVNDVTTQLPNYVDLLYHLARSWHGSMPLSYTRVSDVDDLAMQFAAQVLHRARRYDASRGAVSTFITTVCNSYAKDIISAEGRKPNFVLSIDEHTFLSPTLRPRTREHCFLGRVQDFHRNLPEDLFLFVEELLEGKFYRRTHKKRFRELGPRLKELVEKSGLPIEAYLASLAEEMVPPCDVMSAVSR